MCNRFISFNWASFCVLTCMCNRIRLFRLIALVFVYLHILTNHDTVQSLNYAIFGVYRNGPCYKGIVF